MSGDYSSAFNRLARRLYEEMERLDPGAGEYIEWARLAERRREFYRLAIEGIVCSADFRTLAQFSDDNSICGCPEERE